MSETTSVLLIGLDGFGRQHLLNLQRLQQAGPDGAPKAELIAGVSLSDPGPEVRGDVPVYETLSEAQQDGHAPDVVIVSTPISTHCDLATEALGMGADVLLEKPPTATLAQYEALLAEANRAGRRVQVGFQSIGSHALDALDELLTGGSEGAAGRIGELRAVGATGLWLRTESYYERAPWAGRRELDGVQVVDGVVTNPLAHAVKTALHIAGAKRLEDVAELDTELHHAHTIEADDTSIVRLRTEDGIPVTAALTLCAPEQQDPWITVSGTEGEAILYYTRDELVIRPNREAPGNEDAEPETLHFERTNLLENLIDVRSGESRRLLSPLEDHGAFMRVLEAVRTAEPPAQIGEEHLEHAGEGGERHPIIPHIEEHLARAVKAAPSSFSSLGAPWAAEPAVSGQLEVLRGGTGSSTDGGEDGERRTPVAALRTGEDISPTDSPRPFLDEVRTLGGVVVSDQQPLDHTWHLGVGVALQDVNGTNFWGGRTYTREARRYIWREDHGHIETREQTLTDGDGGQQLVQELDWIDAGGEALLRERREVSVAAASGSQNTWMMDVTFELTPAREETVSLGSPGSNGREKGGYGGFFWRLPAVQDALILTAEAEGEEQTHGSVTDWLAVTGEFAPLPTRAGRGGPATLILLRGGASGPGVLGGEAPNPDPWFVRYSGYPGIGMSLAWDTPVKAGPGETVERNLRAVVVDGRLSREQIRGIAQIASARAD